ncbi:MAG: putative NADH:ubiquinone oxidoreductase, subunit RnfC [Herbinix sp.]|jgi:Na+-translocating ferredoxin:NAD+ oxidoreductase RnfC subunit|nr:putative NADH:ubiquinone oxidoreductase, subunit RnfC [Herbinix sp.]
MDIQQLRNILKDSGIVGAGGAGFPTYAKLDERVDTIILNCAECEPLLYLHRQLLEMHSLEIMKAFEQMAVAMGAKSKIIAIKKTYKDTLEAVQSYQNQFDHLEVCELEEVYPAGDEVVLIYEATGKVIPPGALPIESGIAVFNVETVYNSYCAITKGEPVTDKLITITGEVEHPLTIRVPIGMEVSEAIALAGKTTTEEPCYLMGGPMMGQLVSKRSVITKTSNSILILPKDHIVVRKKEKNNSIDLKRAAAACCQCSMCTDLCPRYLLGHPIEPSSFMLAATCKNVQKTEVFINTLFCSSCGLCEMYSCMQGLSPRTLITEYKSGLRRAGVPTSKIAEFRPVAKEIKYRRVPMERLISRLGLNAYQKKAPLIEQMAHASRVKIMMSQHIGVPALPLVKTGDYVQRGQLIGAPEQGLCVGMHASISGKVLEANEKYIIIVHEQQKGRVSYE